LALDGSFDPDEVAQSYRLFTKKLILLTVRGARQDKPFENPAGIEQNLNGSGETRHRWDEFDTLGKFHKSSSVVTEVLAK